MRGLAAHQPPASTSSSAAEAQCDVEPGRIGRPDAVGRQRLRLADGQRPCREHQRSRLYATSLAHSRRPRSSVSGCESQTVGRDKDAGTADAGCPVETECKPDTAVGKVIAGLSGKTKPDAIEKLAGLNAQQEARLQTLITDLAGDPARTVRQLQAQETRITTVIERIERLTAAANDENRTTLREVHGRLATARTAAAAASASLFAEEPLPDIGSDIWKALWEAARAYSREAAYPEQPFPVTGSGAHCVLCQQPLGEEAARRLTSFEAFVQDESKRREQDAADTYDELIEQLSSQVFLMKGLPVFAALIRDDIGEAELAQALRRQIVQLSWRLRRCFEPIPRGPADAAAGGRRLATRVARHTGRDCHPDRGPAIGGELPTTRRPCRRARRLADRKWLGVVKADLLAQIERAKAVRGA